jgi:hypothetical protein
MSVMLRAFRASKPHAARTRPQVQCRQRVDLSGARDRRDRPQNPLRLVDAGAVVRVNAFQVGFDDALRGDLLLEDRLLNPLDGRLVHVEARRAPSLLLCASTDADIEQQQEGQQIREAACHV